MDSTGTAPEYRFCDLVMKGGITSGVVYPVAIAELAKYYRFKSIGGTSAGAIAAAITAAAEYQRRETGSNAGFDLLKGIPHALGAPAGSDAARSKLLSLFQASPDTRRLFSVLLASLNAGSTGRRILAVLRGLLEAYWSAVAASVILYLLVALPLLKSIGPLSFLVGLPVLLLALLVSLGAFVYYDVTRKVEKNGYGLCTGMTMEPRNVALTPWLHAQIQEAAGLKNRKEPLTFGDLWNAEGFPPSGSSLPKGRSIDLQMFTTNLTQGRPYIFPLPARDPPGTTLSANDRLFFRESEVARYVPKDVLDCLLKTATPYERAADRIAHDPPTPAGIGLLEVPPPESFPVLLAARMSLSFPFLFAAVPLWAIDYNPEKAEDRTFRRCWFSDGGISSNFPIHLFDGLLPLWPTFGIDLEPKIPSRENMVYLPTNYAQGYGERWDGFGEAPKAAARFGGFLSAIVSTMQNWNDNALARMPGVRDRIARVRLNASEGGMNLNMEQTTIAAVATRGATAAAELIARFAAQPASDPETEGWDEQRWVRLCVLLKMIEERVPGLIAALDASVAHVTPYEVLVDRDWVQGKSSAPPGYESSLTAAEREAFRYVLEGLSRVVNAVPTPAAGSNFKAVPKPELRVRPPL